MYKKIFIGVLVLAMSLPVFGAKLTQKQLVFRDETGKKLGWTTLTSVTIQDAGTTTTSSIYSDRNGNTSLTNPIVSGLSDPLITFWSKDADYKVVATDGTYTLTADNVTGSDGWLVFPRYLQAMSSRTANDSQSFTFGTTSDWVAAAQDSGMDWTPAADNSAFHIGTTTYTSDLFLYGGTANYDLQWDASRNHLTVRDNTAIGFGAGAASGTVDYTIKTAGSTNPLIITAVAADDAVQIGDGTIATDFKIQNTTTATADIWWDDSAEILHFGVTDYGIDVKFWGDTAGDYALWDESEDELVFEDAKAVLNEGSYIIFQDSGDATDWSAGCNTAERLEFLPTETTDDQSFNIGNATNTSDFRLFGATASTVIYDASADRVIYSTYDQEIEDTAKIYLGSDDEFALYNASEVFTILPSDTDDDFEFHIGTATNTADLKVFMKTASEHFIIDASADSATFVGDLALFTLTGTTLPYHANVTGTVAGDAIKLETTNGGYKAQIDGVANGDYTVNVGDEYLLDATGGVAIDSAESAADAIGLVASDAAGGITLNAGTAGITASGDLLKNFRYVTEVVTADDTLTTAESGTIYFVTNDTDGISLTLPAVGATDDGIWFTVCDVNATAASDVTMEPGTGDSISSGSANEGFSSDGADKIPCSATFIYNHSATNWYVLIQELDTGTAAWAPDGS